MINTIPDKTAVAIDSEIKGHSPLRVGNIGSGDRQLTVTFPGYKSLNVYVKAINGYQLVFNGFLAEEEIEVTDSQPKTTVTPNVLNSKTAKIKITETGWLRVRDQPSSSGVEISKVKPEEKYPVLEESGDWIKIDLGDNKTGWISASYALIDE